MVQIFKNMKKYWKYMIVIFVFLFVQAMCDLSLPNFTSDLIDVGITGNGIEYAVPEIISGESYGLVESLMLEEEQADWEKYYEYNEEDDTYTLTEEGKEIREELEDTFTTPLVIASASASMDPQMLAAMEAGMVDAETIRDSVSEQFEAVGETMEHSMAIAFVEAEYEKVDVDIDEIRSDYLWKTGAKMLGMSLLMAISAIIVSLFASKTGAGVGRDLRDKVFKKVVGLSQAEMNQFSTASLITRSTNDVQQIQMVTTMLLRMVLYAPFLAIGGLIMVVQTKSGMTWIIGVAIAAILVMVGTLMVLAMPKFKKMQELVDRVNLVSREILTGLPVIRAFAREKEEEKRFDWANADLTKTMLFTNRVMTFMMPLLMIIMNAMSVLIVWVASNKIDEGTMEVGTMTAFITYTMMIVMGFLMLTMVSVMLPRAAVAANRIQEVLDSEDTILDVETPEKMNHVEGVVAFHHVDFKYPDAEECILTDIDFTARPGETTAIIGSTGSGKSTLVQLLPRFFDITSGEITIDGTDIRKVAQKDLRAQIGYVPQKGVLFSGTIESNLRYGAEDATQEEIEMAAQIAQATEFIEQKAERYSSPISQGGSNVSGGQKQRLSIARAIAKNPKIYIFDDSFSALDFKTDTALRKALAPKVKDATVFIVAQRISTILYADQILVLDEGKLVGKGTHKELMNSCEVYQQIAKSQLSEKELQDMKDGKEEA